MQTLKIKNIIIGEGLPKICLPLMGRSRDQLIHATRENLHSEADMYELRADYLDNPGNTDELTGILEEVRSLIGDCPLVFTLRSESEGGACTLPCEDYVNINKAAIRSGFVDIIDIEYAKGPETVSTLITAARETGTFSLLSQHFTEGMPPKEQILSFFADMQTHAADIIKFAATAQSERDLLILLDASLAMRDELSDRPFAAIAMGDKGILSRVGGGLFGSALTFARGSEASAPGQLEVSAVRCIMNRLHGIKI
ncbi:type I 3-dehydroquinate dehydratase [Bacillota bacterium]